MERITFPPVELPPAAEALRQEVRAFVDEELAAGRWDLRNSDFAGSNDVEFSRRLAARGWIGMTWPKKYGGQERSALERYVLTEELLAAGAPVGAHWVADRQSGPLLLRFGSEEQRQRYLPPVARGEAFFCIGMSEPDTGSDLASVRTTARRDNEGWIVNGTKIWTSGAHIANQMIALVRTSPAGEARHEGLSQFIIDLDRPGITIRPIINLSGAHHFNEVVFTDCQVPPDALIGEEGKGWLQVTSELAYERSGPERFLSSFRSFVELVRVVGSDPDPQTAAVIGRLAAQLMTLRQMSLSVAGMLQAGHTPNVEAALVKDQGAMFEKPLPEIARQLVPAEPSQDAADPYDRILARNILDAPSFTLRGGTREILRGVIARGLGLR